eukprot:TRINITY_DN7236_c0_g3_i1.p2 TRINITY_DN7236_c0_g3~~TRINITY_DN7236_c0_g3_i1.p2  ORF type:complete len:199 (+),score=32.60 TRINITY_DN7236_c0_g3_i1:216-812(+)
MADRSPPNMSHTQRSLLSTSQYVDVGVPVSNRVLAAQWDESRFVSHLQRVATARSTIDNRPPAHQGHLSDNRKRQEMERERLQRIHTENRRMVEKMNKIYTTPNDFFHPPKASKSMISSAGVNRRKRLAQIDQENQALFRRLTTNRPTYQRDYWDYEHDKQERYRRNVTQLPEIKHKPVTHRQGWVDTVSNPHILDVP